MEAKKITASYRVEYEDGRKSYVEFELIPETVVYELERDVCTYESPNGYKQLGPDDTYRLKIEGSLKKYWISSEVTAVSIKEWVDGDVAQSG